MPCSSSIHHSTPKPYQTLPLHATVRVVSGSLVPLFPSAWALAAFPAWTRIMPAPTPLRPRKTRSGHGGRRQTAALPLDEAAGYATLDPKRWEGPIGRRSTKLALSMSNTGTLTN
ncbi:hypothetical protein F5Y12DRAFT_710282 [Xylaria sp. FL1777]|nr:hypothetical protein F5Y12DRAFT_710282 [Xylaria sp. FL1777]